MDSKCADRKDVYTVVRKSFTSCICDVLYCAKNCFSLRVRFILKQSPTLTYVLHVHCPTGIPMALLARHPVCKNYMDIVFLFHLIIKYTKKNCFTLSMMQPTRLNYTENILLQIFKDNYWLFLDTYFCKNSDSLPVDSVIVGSLRFNTQWESKALKWLFRERIQNLKMSTEKKTEKKGDCKMPANISAHFVK